jgi:hypothetical protein
MAAIYGYRYQEETPDGVASRLWKFIVSTIQQPILFNIRDTLDLHFVYWRAAVENRQLRQGPDGDMHVTVSGELIGQILRPIALHAGALIFNKPVTREEAFSVFQYGTAITILEPLNSPTDVTSFLADPTPGEKQLYQPLNITPCGSVERTNEIAVTLATFF